MHRPQPARRRSRYGPLQVCAAAATVILLFLSLSVLHTRLSSSPLLGFLSSTRQGGTTSSSFSQHDLLLVDDAANDEIDSGVGDDRIDDLDDFVEQDHMDSNNNKNGAGGDDEDDPDLESDDQEAPFAGSGLFWDHVLGVARRSFGKREDRSPPHQLSFDSRLEDLQARDSGALAFGSDDQPLDEGVRLKLDYIRKIEDALLVKVDSRSPLREGWDRWLEGKMDFLRRDRMLRSNLEQLLPKSHPLLQDPDLPGITSLSKGDKLVQKALLEEMMKKSSPVSGHRSGSEANAVERRRVLDLGATKEAREVVINKAELKDKRSLGGLRWGYFPGLDPYLSFSEFMDSFLGHERCSLRAFMVWNTPSWTYGVRHQRGLESLLYHHRDACVVVFSETLELDFFRAFLNEGFRIAVVMPNLDELLKDTPCHVFASVWYDWKKTKFYPIHYSQLVRLAAIFKYGGVYLDSDVIVLRPIHTLMNFVGVEDQIIASQASNGVVISFQINSPFIMECLMEFYLTYDDTNPTWNGADLMTRVFNRLNAKADKSGAQIGVKIEPPQAFFPISPKDITRYFAEASNDTERSGHEALFTKIANESTVFHYWNNITSGLVPEPNSLVARLLNLYCLHCQDVL